MHCPGSFRQLQTTARYGLFWALCLIACSQDRGQKMHEGIICVLPKTPWLNSFCGHLVMPARQKASDASD